VPTRFHSRQSNDDGSHYPRERRRDALEARLCGFAPRKCDGTRLALRTNRAHHDVKSISNSVQNGPTSPLVSDGRLVAQHSDAASATGGILSALQRSRIHICICDRHFVQGQLSTSQTHLGSQSKAGPGRLHPSIDARQRPRACSQHYSIPSKQARDIFNR
jgi:hypothetical protein